MTLGCERKEGRDVALVRALDDLKCATKIVKDCRVDLIRGLQLVCERFHLDGLRLRGFFWPQLIFHRWNFLNSIDCNAGDDCSDGSKSQNVKAVEQCRPKGESLGKFSNRCSIF